MWKVVLSIMAVIGLLVGATTIALGQGNGQGRPVAFRSVLTKNVDPAADGDVVYTYTNQWGLTITEHFARFRDSAVKLADPPLIQVLYKPNTEQSSPLPLAPNAVSIASIMWPNNIVQVREGEILVLFKRTIPATNVNLVFMEPESDGLIHLTVVVVH